MINNYIKELDKCYIASGWLFSDTLFLVITLHILGSRPLRDEVMDERTKAKGKT